MNLIASTNKNVHLAEKTLAAIDLALEADQGASFRGWLGKVISHMSDAYNSSTESHRSHMGASLLGGECSRAIWLGFRWATKSNFPGRILRLFNRGHLEEARFIALLLMIGVQVYQQDENGKQYRISFADGHAGGSGDGIGIGIPDLGPGTAAILEFKTHSQKSFNDLKKNGVREAKFEHFVQTNLYMRKMGIPVTLYMAVNKDNDDIYAELIYLDERLADSYILRAEELVPMEIAPKRISESPGFFKCKWCNQYGVCHQGKPYDFNCRTCTNSKIGSNGTWICTLTGEILSKEMQLSGCQAYNEMLH